MKQKHAKLRVCMSCEWIHEQDPTSCPKCGWPSCGARFVYGNKAYSHRKTQRPWKDRKMFAYSIALDKEIREATP
jgi:hypothetical protein